MAASELESLYQLSLRLGATLDRSQEAALFMEWAQAEAQPRLAVLFAADESRRSLCILAAHGLQAQSKSDNLMSAVLPIGLDPWKWLQKTGARLPRTPARQRYSLPIILEGELMGLFCVVSARSGVELQNEQRLLELGLAHLAPVLRNIERYEGVERLVQQRTQALAASEARFRALIEKGHDYISLLAADGTLLWESPAIYRMLDYAEDQFVGHNIFELVHPDDIEWVRNEFIKLTQSPGGSQSGEFRLRHSSGSWRWVEAIATNRLHEPYIQAIVINYRDITERKLAEEAIRKAEERLRAIVEQVPAVVYTESAADGKLLFISPQIEALSGYTAEQWLSEPDLWKRIIHPDDLPQVESEDRRTNQTGEPFRAEYRILNRDGQTVWLLDEATLIRDEAGKPAYWQGFMLDVTQRKRAEEATHRAEERLRALIEQAPAVVFSTSAEDDRLLFISPQIEALSGYPVEQWLGEPNFWRKVIHPDDLARVIAEEQRTSASGEPYRIECRMIAKDGRIVWLYDEAALIRDSAGKPMYWQGIMVDITERKRREREIEAQALLAQALSETHELQPLLERILQAALHVVPTAEKGSVALLADEAHLRVRAMYGYHDLDVLGFIYPIQWGYAGRALRECQPLLIKDLQQDLRLQEDAQTATIVEVQALRSAIAVPLLARGAAIGVLSVESSKANSFNETDRDTLVAMASTAALVIERAHLYEETQQRLDELSVLHGASQILLMAKLDPDSTYTAVHQAAASVMPCEAFVIVLEDEAQGDYYGVYLYDKSGRQPSQRIPRGKGFSGQVLSSGKTLLINNYPDQSEVQAVHFDDPEHVRSILAVPLRRGGETFGMISAQSYQPNAYHEGHQRLLETLAAQFAASIENARLFEETHRRAEETSALLETSLALNSLDLTTILHTIGRRAVALFAADDCRIFLLEPDGETLYCELALHVHAEAVRGVRLKLGQGITGDVALRGEAEIVNDVVRDPRAIQVPGTPDEPEAMMLVPLKVGQNVIGVMSVIRLGEIAPFQPEDLRLLQGMAALASSALSNARLYQQTQRRLREMELLASISASLRTAVTRVEMLPPLLDQIMIQMQVDGVAIETLDERTGILHTEWGRGVWSSLVGVMIPPGKGLSAQVLATGQPYFNNDARNDPRLFRPIEFGDLRAAAGVPLTVESKIIGLLWIGSRRTLDEQDLHLLTAVADITANALRRAWLFEQTQRQAQKIAAVNAMGRALAASLDLPTICRTAYQHVRQLVGCDNLGVSLLDDNASTLRAAYIICDGEELDVSLFPPLGIEPQQALNGRAKAAVEGQIVLVNDLGVKRRQRGGALVGDSQEPESAVYAPMVVEGKIIGLLELQSYRNYAYREEDFDLLSMIANQIGLAIQNARLFEETQRRLRELETLQEVSTALRKAQSVDEMIPIFVQRALLAVEAQAGSIYLLEESSGDWVSSGWINVKGEWLSRRNEVLRHHPGEGVTGYVGSSGEFYYTEDWRTDPLTITPPGEEQLLSAYCSGISLPLRAEERIIGVMHLWRVEKRAFSTSEQRMLLAIAEMAGSALQRARLHEETLRRLAQLHALQTIDRAISSSLDVHFSLDVLLRQTLAQLKVDAAGVLLYNPSTLSLEYAAGRGFRTRTYEQSRLAMGKGVAGRAAFEQRMMLIPDLSVSQAFLRREFQQKEGFVSYAAVPLVAKGTIKGVLEIFHRAQLNFDSEWLNFVEGLALQAAIAIDNGQMFEGLQRTNMELSLAYDAAIEGWVRALDLRDRETENHTQRVTELTVALARAMGFDEQKIIHLRRGAILHDIGKMAIPDSILQKPGPLSAEEWEIMRRHPQFAYDMLYPVRYLRPALDIPYCHHERWDGSGYPQGLKGEEIPLAARLFAVVDVFDALTSNRPYRAAWSRAEAIAYLRQQAGILFDPQVVEAFLKIIQPQS